VDQDSAGVEAVNYIEGNTRHALTGISGTTYVRITAVDISGNESAVSALASGTPLAGSAGQIEVTVDNAVGLIGAEFNESFQLGIGVNVTPDPDAPTHAIIAAGWTPRVGSIHTPVHFFFVPEPGYPPIEDNLLFVEVAPLDGERSVICTQAFALADRVAADPRYLDDLQRRIARRLEWLFPFLDRHLVKVSSPWILPEHLREGVRVSPAERLARSPARMPCVPRVPPGSALGLTCLSPRLAGRHLFLTGRDVIPGLGDEGVFLSAWAVARTISQKDPRRVRLRRELGSMIES